MDKWFFYAFVAQGEFVRAHADIPFFEQIALLVFQVTGVDQYPQSNIEFALVDQKRLLYVLLNYENFRFDIRRQERFRTPIRCFSDSRRLLLLFRLLRKFFFFIKRTQLLFISQYLAAGIVHIKVHFISDREFFHQAPQLLQSVEQLDSTPSVKIIGLYQPDVRPLVHLIVNVIFPGDHAFVFTVGLHKLVLLDVLVYLLYLGLIVLFAFPYPFYTVEVLAELVDFRDEVLGGKVQNELYWQILEHVDFVMLAEFVHVHEDLILGCQYVMSFKMIDDLLLTVCA